MSLRLLQKPVRPSGSADRVHCCACEQKEVCSQSTRVFVHYCGSMTAILKEQISRANTECRQLRRTRLFPRPAMLSREPQAVLMASH